MIKSINYTSQNLFDIRCLKARLENEITELNVQKRIIDGKIDCLTDIIDALERHIDSVEEQNKEVENND